MHLPVTVKVKSIQVCEFGSEWARKLAKWMEEESIDNHTTHESCDVGDGNNGISEAAEYKTISGDQVHQGSGS
jgi:hypothetical protein